MASLKSIRKRIASVKNTQKITKAMKMVAAANLRRAQQRLVQARPYADKTEELLARVAALCPDHPLLVGRPEAQKAAFLVLTSDRGLCGGFNGNLLRRIEDTLKDPERGFREAEIHMIGRKGRDFFKSRDREMATSQTGVYEKFNYETALKMTRDFIAGFTGNKFDHLYLVFNYFRSAISQEIRIDRILPVEPKLLNRTSPAADGALKGRLHSRRSQGGMEGATQAPIMEPQQIEGYVPEYLYEPARREILEALIPHCLATRVHRAFLESIAGEYGARMAAMENATNNCSDMIHSLTLQLNRARQASITTELMDIVNGAEALK